MKNGKNNIGTYKIKDNPQFNLQHKSSTNITMKTMEAGQHNIAKWVLY